MNNKLIKLYQSIKYKINWHWLSYSEVDGSNDISPLSNSNGNHHSSPISIFNNGHYHYTDENSTLKRITLGRSEAKRLHRKMKKYQIGEATDDVRLCVMCLRAIMNNQVSRNLYFIEGLQSLEKLFNWVYGLLFIYY